jgi:integrase
MTPETTPVPIPWPEFKARLLDSYATMAASTRKELRQVLAIVEGLGVTSTAELTSRLVMQFIAGRPPGQSPNTTRKLLRVLRAACNQAEEMGHARSPFSLRSMQIGRLVRATPPAGKRFFGPGEVRAVLEHMAVEAEVKRGWAQWRARRLYALTATVAYLGTRASESQRSRVDDYDLVNRVCYVKPHDRKLKTAASEAPVAVPAALVPILTGWLEHRLDHPAGMVLPPAEEIPWMFPGTRRRCPWVNGAPGHEPVDRLKIVAARAGVEGMTFQGLRRSWCTRAEGLGIPQSLITRQARHTSEQTTRRYYQQRDLDALRDAVNGFTY